MKTPTALALALVMILSLAACGGASQPTATPEPAGTIEPTPTSEPTVEVMPEPKFDLDKYKSLVSECRAEMNDASIYVGNVGTYEINYWNNLGKLSDTMVASAFEWLEEKSGVTRESVDASYDRIRKQYKEIILIEIDGNEANEINTSFRSMYDAYESIYSMVTSPSGTVASFASELSGYIGDFSDSNEDLSLFLD